MKRSLLFSFAVLAVLIPATLYLGSRLSGQAYYLTSTLVVMETMIPFFLRFEHRKPQARELVLLAVMCALSVAARVAVQFPNFKPTLAIIMITGIAFGPEAGFLTGAVTAFASNFAFAQGPWTPWQMMAYGVGGFLAGLCFHKRRLFAAHPRLQAAVLALFGFFSILLLVGPLLDCSTLFTTGTKLTWRYAGMVFLVGLRHNIPHGLATALTLLLLGRPLLRKLDRVRRKYGLLDDDSAPTSALS